MSDTFSSVRLLAFIKNMCYRVLASSFFVRIQYFYCMFSLCLLALVHTITLLYIFIVSKRHVFHLYLVSAAVRQFMWNMLEKRLLIG